MKATCIKSVVAFQPVSLNITFESQKELSIFTAMLGLNLTIPSMLTKDVEDQNALTSVMCTIREALQNDK